MNRESERNTRGWRVLVLLGLGALPASAELVVADFGDVTLPEAGYVNGADGAGGHTSAGLWFENTFTDFGGGFTAWSGWSVSSVNNPGEGGYANQYAAITAGGATDTGVAEAGNAYGMAFVSGGQAGAAVHMPLQTTAAPQSVYLTNGAYPYYSMRDGDDFSKQFGGPEGSDADYFRVEVLGYDANGAETGRTTVYLADFRNPDSANDFIVDAWQMIDLTPLGTGVVELRFEVESSDEGVFGINTPTYFALDRLSVELNPQILAGAEDLGDGWKRSSWFGVYYDAQAPWIYSYPLGWLKWSSINEADVWFYSEAAGAWFWTSAVHHPYIYREKTRDWVYFFHLSKPAALQYYDVANGVWVTGASHL